MSDRLSGRTPSGRCGSQPLFGSASKPADPAFQRALSRVIFLRRGGKRPPRSSFKDLGGPVGQTTPSLSRRSRWRSRSSRFWRHIRPTLRFPRCDRHVRPVSPVESGSEIERFLVDNQDELCLTGVHRNAVSRNGEQFIAIPRPRTKKPRERCATLTGDKVVDRRRNSCRPQGGVADWRERLEPNFTRSPTGLSVQSRKRHGSEDLR